MRFNLLHTQECDRSQMHASCELSTKRHRKHNIKISQPHSLSLFDKDALISIPPFIQNDDKTLNLAKNHKKLSDYQYANILINIVFNCYKVYIHLACLLNNPPKFRCL